MYTEWFEKKVRAYCPGHISSIFRVCRHEDLLYAGSRGAGIVIDEGVITEVETFPGSGVSVYFNDLKMDFKPSLVMAKKMIHDSMSGIIIRHSTRLPLGAGFGVSGACVLGVGLCLNRIFSLGKSMKEIGQAAHVTEIDCGTGLGDVGPMLVGGIELRKKEGAPGYGIVEDIKSDFNDIVCFSFGKIETNKVIRDNEFSEINKVADNILAKLFADPCFDKFMQCSIEFADKAGFLTERLSKVLDRLNEIDGCFASQTMLGESGFVVFDKDTHKNVPDKLSNIDCVFKTKTGYRLPELI